MDWASSIRCPTCSAAFRGSRECSRCGSDLGPILALATLSAATGAAARNALHGRDFARAHQLASRAVTLRTTPGIRGLALLTSWLVFQGRKGPAKK